MGAANFPHRVETNNHYVVILEPFMDEETGEMIEDLSLDYKLIIENFEADLYEKGFNLPDEHPRNRTIKNVIARRFQKLQNVDVETFIRLIPGYYQGYCLDFDLRFFLDDGYHTWEFDMEQRIEDLEDFLAEKYENKGLAKINAPKLEKHLKKIVEQIRAEVEEIFKEHATHILTVEARFSNGETWYKNVS